MKIHSRKSKEMAAIPATGPDARRASRLGGLLFLLAASGSAHAAQFEHTTTLSFCAMTSKVHATCTSRVRDGNNIVALDVNCSLTRDIAGGGMYAMAESRRRVGATNESVEVTQFDAPHRFDARYCSVNRGKYVQSTVLGPTVISYPRQDESQSCATQAPPNPGVDQ